MTMPSPDAEEVSVCCCFYNCRIFSLKVLRYYYYWWQSYIFCSLVASIIGGDTAVEKTTAFVVQASAESGLLAQKREPLASSGR